MTPPSWTARDTSKLVDLKDMLTRKFDNMSYIPIAPSFVQPEIIKACMRRDIIRLGSVLQEEDEQFADFQKILENLSELETDGLVQIGDREIIVTEKGRPFVRNISMVFDLKLHRKKPDTRIFSMTV